MRSRPTNPRPRFSESEALGLLSELYGLESIGGIGESLRELVSYGDQNFLATVADGDRFVLKISAAGQERSALELESLAMERLAGAGSAFSFPEVVPAGSGRSIEEARDAAGREHLVLSHSAHVDFAEVRRKR